MSDIPKVSIIITSYQRLDFIKNLIESIFNYTDHSNFEVVVVNTYPGYNDKLDKYIESLEPKCKIVSDGKKRQFLEGIEAGYEVADGDYILAMNDDMLVSKTQPNWMSSMQNYLLKNPDCATCSIYQYLDGMSLYTIGETDINKPGHSCGRFRLKLDKLPNEKEVLWNNFSCVMISREYLEDNRFLDVVPEPQYHYGSDSCYCRHVINTGKMNILINDSWIYHFNSRVMRGRYGRYTYPGR